MTEILYESEIAVLNFIKENHLVELIWKKTTNSEEFRRIYLVGLDFARKKKVLLFLSDMRNEGPIAMEDVQWLETIVITEAGLLGLQKIGLVTDESLFHYIYSATLKKKLTENAMKVGIFDSVNSAKEWLLAKE